MLRHPNIIRVREMVVGGPKRNKIYMVMDYMEHDLQTLMSKMKRNFTQSEVKCMLRQLLTRYPTCIDVGSFIAISRRRIFCTETMECFVLQILDWLENIRACWGIHAAVVTLWYVFLSFSVLDFRSTDNEQPTGTEHRLLLSTNNTTHPLICGVWAVFLQSF